MELIGSVIGLALIYGLFRAMGGNGTQKLIDLRSTNENKNIALRVGVIFLVFFIIAGTVVLGSLKGGKINKTHAIESLIIVLIGAAIVVLLQIRRKNK